MKKYGRSLMLLMLSLMLVFFDAVSVRAEQEDYTYTVRIYSGQQGTFLDGSNVITITGLAYNELVEFKPADQVVVKDTAKYYIKGIRESGKDNNISVVNLSFSVKGDADYVVAYGLDRDKVSYTVNYIDSNGNALAPSDVYYGSVGDKPVVAYLYIEGYLPQAYNLTKLLVKNEAENVFTFIYTPFSGNTGDVTVNRTVTGGTTRSVVEVIPGETVRRSLRGSGNGSDTENTQTAETGGGQGGTQQETGELDEIAEAETPRELLDLDEPEVPLAGQKLSIGPIEADARIVFSVLAILTAAAVIAAASWWYWGHRGKREQNNEE